MFTGIIEEIGTIKNIKKGDNSSSFTIRANKVLEDTKVGDSICTNGVCLTVKNIYKETFEADIMAETLRVSNLGSLKIGSRVNLERALSLNTRLGGHMVSGHIDGLGQIILMQREDIAVVLTIRPQKDILKYIIYKGSVAIDGISLTVSYVDDEVFKVSIIPHTGEETILLSKTIGENVNIECDLVGKYIERLLGFKSKEDGVKKTSLTEDFLKENGFL
ncbi:riboflavin synthase [Asaccharospora irregularis]|uniref:Riboflavin synthase n=1 Tax=Asaccharospora irregularis DSM 2635 TaxID=1121321 RepID=A0A1M5KV92_9FIRM|nr:riboflavin synthase [Asaccharospora irregularis]SHG56688.1 riboflavin synthase alpha chain [Asaccharospora irregularis DSM 2635]